MNVKQTKDKKQTSVAIKAHDWAYDCHLFCVCIKRREKAIFTSPDDKRVLGQRDFCVCLYLYLLERCSFVSPKLLNILQILTFGTAILLLGHCVSLTLARVGLCHLDCLYHLLACCYYVHYTEMCFSYQVICNFATARYKFKQGHIEINTSYRYNLFLSWVLPTHTVFQSGSCKEPEDSEAHFHVVMSSELNPSDQMFENSWEGSSASIHSCGSTELYRKSPSPQ